MLRYALEKIGEHAQQMFDFGECDNLTLLNFTETVRTASQQFVNRVGWVVYI
jgi:hypothetical protein